MQWCRPLLGLWQLPQIRTARRPRQSTAKTLREKWSSASKLDARERFRFLCERESVATAGSERPDTTASAPVSVDGDDDFAAVGVGVDALMGVRYVVEAEHGVDAGLVMTVFDSFDDGLQDSLVRGG